MAPLASSCRPAASRCRGASDAACPSGGHRALGPRTPGVLPGDPACARSTVPSSAPCPPAPLRIRGVQPHAHQGDCRRDGLRGGARARAPRRSWRLRDRSRRSAEPLADRYGARPHRPCTSARSRGMAWCPRVSVRGRSVASRQPGQRGQPVRPNGTKRFGPRARWPGRSGPSGGRPGGGVNPARGSPLEEQPKDGAGRVRRGRL